MSGETYSSTLELDTDSSGLTLDRCLVTNYNITDVTYIRGLVNDANNFTSMEIDGEKQTISTNYKISTTGSHKIRFFLKDKTSILDSTFYYCSSLTSIDIPDSITTIGKYAFEKCTSLTSITIPDSVTDIADYLLYLNDIKTIYYQGTLEQWNNLKITNESSGILETGGLYSERVVNVICNDGNTVTYKREAQSTDEAL